MIFGHLDYAGFDCISGWVAKSENLNESLKVDIYADSLYLGSTYNNKYRSDVQDFFGGNGVNGFCFYPDIVRVEDLISRTIKVMCNGVVLSPVNTTGRLTMTGLLGQVHNTAIGSPPLNSNARNFSIFISAKSGCTFLTKWFFYHAGLLKFAYEYHPWPHNFRWEVYYKTKEYTKTMKKLLSKNRKSYVFVRNPYARTVSVYLQMIQNTFMDKPMSVFLQRDVTKTSYSFSEFIDYISSIDIFRCDIHIRAQFNPLEIFCKDLAICHLENSFEYLRQIEKTHRLKPSKLIQLRKSQHHAMETGIATNQKLFLGDTCFTAKNYPKTAFNFYNAEISEKVYNIYKVDFLRYGFDTQLPALPLS